jgi:hypothetical protein
VRIESGAGEPPDNTVERDEAVETARALLHPIGGTIEIGMDPDSGTRRVVLVNLPSASPA